MSETFDITKIKNGNGYFDKNIIKDEKDILYNIHENVKKSEFKDYEALRKYLIENHHRAIEYDSKMEMRPSCLKRLDCLVKAYKGHPNTIEEWNYVLEQIMWR